MLLMGLTILLGVLRPWPMVFLIDYALKERPMPPWISALIGWLPASHNRVQLVSWSVAATILIFLLDWACGLASRYVTVTLAQRMTYEVAGDLLSHLQRLSLRWHTSWPVGDSIRRVTTDCGCVAIILRDALLPVISSLSSLLVMFVIMWQISVPLTLISLLVVPCMGLIFWFYAQPMLDRSYEEQAAEAHIYELVERTFSSIPAVQAFGREQLNDELFRRTTANNLLAVIRSSSIQLQFKLLIGLVTAGGTAGILWLGAKEAMAGEMTAGAIVLFLSYLASLYSPIESVMYTGSQIQSAGGSAKRVLDILSTEREVTDQPHAEPLHRSRGHIRFDNVSFWYDRGPPTLCDISFEVQPGETVALIGPTGAGKSTLVSLIPRFFDPTKGCILLDGRELRGIRLADLRRQVALVLQEPFLFPLSVAENIAYGQPGASMKEIEQAAHAANAHDFICRLPHGYDTVLGDRGATLSGGERQRLSIARALLVDAPILILDEPTSAIDARTEALIIAAMQKLIRGRTTFIIAHRLGTVRNAERVLVLQEGRIVESGTPYELTRRNGLYARYLALQSIWTEPPRDTATSGEAAP
jgi:ATP-binding cassette, subfamily B, bacterial